MTKTFNFYSKKNNTNNSFFLKNKPTNYSSILDDIIASDIIDKNSYLFKKDYDDIILTGSNLKDSNDFAKATAFLANYNTKKSYKLPFILGKMYTLSDGTPIVFYDDEIQIGFDVFKYSKFADLSFLNNLTTKTKKIILNIYTFGNSNIEINIL